MRKEDENCNNKRLYMWEENGSQTDNEKVTNVGGMKFSPVMMRSVKGNKQSTTEDK